MSQSWPSLLSQLLDGLDLTTQDTSWAMREIFSGNATDAQTAAFAMAMRAKKEVPAEVAGLAGVMLDFATPLPLPPGTITVDTCGTGGDRAHTVNISTMAALVVAGAGATVAKHGNRAASSSCGSADVLEELGVSIDAPPEHVARSIIEIGIGFCFAPQFHPAMRHAGSIRREIGVPTFFNILGPLTNPARPAAQVVGVPDPRLAALVADVFKQRPVSVLVVRGDDGLDELTTYTTSTVWWVRDGAVSQHTVDPRALGIEPPPSGALVGGDPAKNAAAVRTFLAGEKGPIREAVLLNAAAALVAIEPSSGDLTAALGSALKTAADAVDSGATAAVLDRWIAFQP